VIGTDVPHADVVTHETTILGFFSCAFSGPAAPMSATVAVSKDRA
jgi:hypothetical protein